MTPILWDPRPGPNRPAFPRPHAASGVGLPARTAEQIVSTGMDRTIRLWDSASGEENHCFRGHAEGVTWVAVSPDGADYFRRHGVDTTCGSGTWSARADSSGRLGKHVADPRVRSPPTAATPFGAGATASSGCIASRTPVGPTAPQCPRRRPQRDLRQGTVRIGRLAAAWATMCNPVFDFERERTLLPKSFHPFDPMKGWSASRNDSASGKRSSGSRARQRSMMSARGAGEIRAARADRDGILLQDLEDPELHPFREIIHILARQQVVERRPRGIEVARRQHVAVARDLLGRHERRRSLDVSGDRQAAQAGGLVDVCQAEIGQLQRLIGAGTRDQRLGGLISRWTNRRAWA